MEMPLWRSACAAARDERQQLYDEMARLRAKYRTTISKLADDFIQEESDLRSRMEAFEDRSAILRLSVEPHESSSQPVLKRARDYEYDFAPVAPERLQPAPVTNDYVFAPVAPERLQPAPTRPPVFANWSEDEVEQPKSGTSSVGFQPQSKHKQHWPGSSWVGFQPQNKSNPAEVPHMEVELPESLWFDNGGCFEVVFADVDGVDLIQRART
jgi:hypothetical protein